MFIAIFFNHFMPLVFQSNFVFATTCSEALSGKPRLTSSWTLHRPQKDFKSYQIKPGEFIHGTSAQVIARAIESGAIHGRSASEFTAAISRYSNGELAFDSRLIYVHRALQASEKSLQEHDQNPNLVISPDKELRSSIGYAENVALGHSFADLLNVDWANLNIFLSNDLVSIRRDEMSFEWLIDQNPENLATRTIIETIMKGKTDDDIDEIIRRAPLYKGVIVIFKNTVAEKYNILPDPETETERGAILASKSGVSLSQVDRIYPLSWNDYYLVENALNKARSTLK